MIKKILLMLALIPGLIVILITSVANRLTSGIDSESIDILSGYLKDFKGTEGTSGLFDGDIGVVFILHKVSEYSHWIITISIIWIVIIIYVLGSQRRINNNEEGQE